MGGEGPGTWAGTPRAGAGARRSGARTPGASTRHSASALIDAVFLRESAREGPPEAGASRSQAQARGLGPLERLDEDVRRLDRLAALGDLLAEVVHEVRNPLVSVKTFLQLLPERLGDPEFLGDFRQLVCEEVLRLERLLDEVLRHSRPGSSAGRGEGADIGACFASVAHLVAHRARERGIEIEREVGAGVDRVAIGRDALRQLLLNLTLNALDATPAGSRIRLGAQKDPCGEGVCISVEDEGRGVAEADRARIFEPFHSTRSERPGGLGLAISRRLVEECGGRIEVRDSASGGACFVVRLATHG